MPTSESILVARSGEPRTRTTLMLEAIALRHQIAVLERSRTRRPCFRLWDRLFWVLFSRCWPRWRDSLIIVQPDTVSRWRRDVRWMIPALHRTLAGAASCNRRSVSSGLLSLFPNPLPESIDGLSEMRIAERWRCRLPPNGGPPERSSQSPTG